MGRFSDVLDRGRKERGYDGAAAAQHESRKNHQGVCINEICGEEAEVISIKPPYCFLASRPASGRSEISSVLHLQRWSLR